jgi:hypothetical protein
MAAVDRRWARWVYGSVTSYLHKKAREGNLPLIVDFEDTTHNTAWANARTRGQATITGPITSAGSPGLFRVVVGVFIAISSKRSLNDYDHIDAVGAMQNALDQCIPIIDAGDTNLLDIGTLTPFQAPIEPVHIKPADQDDTIFSTVNTTYDALFRV